MQVYQISWKQLERASKPYKGKEILTIGISPKNI
jgi:hypothetical protein